MESRVPPHALWLCISGIQNFIEIYHSVYFLNESRLDQVKKLKITRSLDKQYCNATRECTLSRVPTVRSTVSERILMAQRSRFTTCFDELSGTDH